MKSYLGKLITTNAVGITGICKNAGKTTALNAVLSDLYGKTVSPIVAITSIGRDGETTDVVTSTPKPRVYVRCGTLIATAADALRRCDISREIVSSSSISTPMGEVIIVRAKSDGYVELAGPSTTSGLKAVQDEMLDLGADIVIIDGAISRKAFSVQSLCKEVILCSGASYDRSQDKVINATYFAATLLNLPTTRTAFPNTENNAKFIILHVDGSTTQANDSDDFTAAVGKDASSIQDIRVNGAFTDSAAAIILKNAVRNAEISCEDSGNILISNTTFDRLLLRNITLSVQHRSKLIAVTVNPYSVYGAPFDGRMFYDAMQEKMASLHIPVFNCADEYPNYMI